MLSEADIFKAFVDTFKGGSSEDIARHILQKAGMTSDEIAKAATVTTSSGLVAYDLQAPAKNLYPVYAPIRNALPRVRGSGGTATNWRQVNAIIGSGYDASGWVPEGQRSAAMSISTSNKAATYVTLGEEASMTFEAGSAARGFEDEYARTAIRLLQKMFLKEEMGILFGNAGSGNGGIALGTPTAPTTAASGTGATLPAATYSVIVVALTGEGWANSRAALSNVSAGIATSKTVTGQDGQTYTVPGGSSNKSSNTTQAVTLGQVLTASTPAIAGAVAYAWYVGTAGSEKLEAITTINSVSFSAPLQGTGQAATAVTADNSANSLAFNGLLTQAAVSGSGAYVNPLATGTAGTGTTLTSSGRGSVNEIDVMMKTMWDTYQVSLSKIFVNSQELGNITKKVISNASGGSLLNYFKNADSMEYILTAGGAVEFYYNPYMAPGAGRKIPIEIHPNVPPGTIIGWANDLPVQYQSAEVPNIAEMKTREDYYQINWPLTTRQRQVGVYVEEVLAIYAPFAMGVISNIANG